MDNSECYLLEKKVGFLKSITSSKKKGLGRKLLIAVLLTSSFFTVLQTSYQMYSDYQLGLNEIEKRFKQMYISYNESLSRSIWDVDPERTRVITQGILSLPNVEYVSVFSITDAQKEELERLDKKSSSELINRKFELTITEDNDTIPIGELNIKISLAPLYSDLYNKLLFISFFQTIKTFSVSIIIFGIFHYLVTQHLINMARFSESIREDNLNEKLTLRRDPPSESDELDAMTNALNDTKSNMKKVLEYNRKSTSLHLELEKKKSEEEILSKHNSEMQQKNIELEKIINELKSTQQKLINSEKMAVLGNMVKGISHELNTPIGVSITGVSHLCSETERIDQLLQEANMTKSDLEGYLCESAKLGKSINISLVKAAELIQSFKLVSVEQHIDTITDFNVRENFDDITKSLKHAFKNRNIEIRNDIPADIMMVSYPGIFYQVYTNLLNNASLHAFEGAESGLISVKAEMNDNLLTINFTDNGIGMNQETKDQLFEPFFTTKRGTGGTGLGMNIVRNLIFEKLQGNVEVLSGEGKGTRFIITVPNKTQQIS